MWTIWLSFFPAYVDEIEFGFGESLGEATTNVNGYVSEEETTRSVEEDSTAFVTDKGVYD